jgi:hypothetical protein
MHNFATPAGEIFRDDGGGRRRKLERDRDSKGSRGVKERGSL